MLSSLLPLLLVNAIVMVGALLQGTVGFGFGMLSAPLLVLIDPQFVPGPLIGAALFLTTLMLVRERSGVDLGGLAWAVPGRFAGAVVAAVILSLLAPGAASILFAGLILFAVVLSASGLHFQPTRPALVTAGVISGITGTITSVGGPPIALVYQSASGPQLRGTLAGYFLFGTTSSLLALTWVGEYSLAGVQLSLSLMPGILIGFLLSRRARHWLDRGQTRMAVLVISSLSASVVIIRQFV